SSISPNVGLKVRGGNENQRLCVVCECLAAALRPLQVSEQFAQSIQIAAGVAVTPHADRKKRQNVGKIVIEQDGRYRSWGQFHARRAQDEVKDIDGNDVIIESVGRAVPVMKNMEAFPRRLGLEGFDERA